MPGVGPPATVVVGVDGAGRTRRLDELAASASGLLYLCSLLIRRDPEASVAVLLLGRAELGGAESFIITAAVSWGLAIVDAQNTGKVIAWVGSAMFAAFAIGAPVGSALYAGYGFVAIALVTALAPLATLLLIAPLPAVVPVPRAQLSFVKVFGNVWVPGFGAALGSVGLACAGVAFGEVLAVRGFPRGDPCDEFGPVGLFDLGSKLQPQTAPEFVEICS